MKDYRIRKEIPLDGKLTYRIEACMYRVRENNFTEQWIMLDYVSHTIMAARNKIDMLRNVGKLYKVESSEIIEYPPKS